MTRSKGLHASGMQKGVGEEHTILPSLTNNYKWRDTLITHKIRLLGDRRQCARARGQKPDTKD